ncbi:formylmethanofuran-tetrahydromethanopterin formyltransferase [Filomicrobium insigne]|uniref:Formylmethanofuran--tetrahydromethanopterin formyltransferase n=2 Tax=Hyphomicrobiaceae TaxID=45401 RepID=A0A1H0SKS0_9HYPH|nr:formylmethanofuran-tetrahydromethanopterin formyltransferase [Filomicrobium insigne]
MSAVNSKDSQPMNINGIAIDDTFAEAFGMSATGIIITADTMKWARQAAITMTGFGTSVIGCGAECGIDYEVPAEETPDGRPGVRVLVFGFAPESIEGQLKNRVGQCVLTSPGSACFNGLEAERRIPLSSGPRFFGDGWQTARKLGDRRFWRVPVMDGEFIIEDTTGVTTDAVGGGNLLVIGRDRPGVLRTCEAAIEAMNDVRDVIMPFPGGIVRSGSKVGSKYKGAVASTNDAFCPTLRGATNSQLGPEDRAVLEIVIDGLTSESVAEAMKVGLKAVLETGPENQVTRVSAGNYGGNLGQHHYHLKDCLP